MQIDCRSFYTFTHSLTHTQSRALATRKWNFNLKLNQQLFKCFYLLLFFSIDNFVVFFICISCECSRTVRTQWNENAGSSSFQKNSNNNKKRTISKSLKCHNHKSLYILESISSSTIIAFESFCRCCCYCCWLQINSCKKKRTMFYSPVEN